MTAENESAIVKRLREIGERVWQTPEPVVAFTGRADADALVNDLKDHPHAYVVGCIADRQMKYQKAWMLPYLLSQRVGGFEFTRLQSLTEQELLRAIDTVPKLHRFPRPMAKFIRSGIHRIADQYNGDASRIWTGQPSSSDVVARFLEFDGVGPKIAHMAANILVRSFKVQLSDYWSIDVSADVHVRRVFGRLGLCRVGASVDEVVAKGRSLSREFPGLLDYSAFEIGNLWCRNADPLCGECRMSDICPSSGSGSM